MTRYHTFTGLFVAEFRQSGQTEITLRNGTDPTGVSFESISLLFQTDIAAVLKQSGIPSLYGASIYTAYPAMVRGERGVKERQDARSGIHSIVLVELVDESAETLVTYVLRLDGADWHTSSLPTALEEGLSAQSESIPIRVPCSYVYYPSTKQLTITSSKLVFPIRVPATVIPQLLNCLPVDMGVGPDGTAMPIMRASGEIAGRLEPTSEQHEGLLIVPDVLTFDYGVALHRLWVNRSTFRWYCTEDLVIPTP